MKVNVPLSYDSITIKQYHEYSLMIERKLEPIQTIAHTISIMCSVGFENVLSFPLSDLKRIYAEMEFLNKEVSQTVLNKTLKVNSYYFHLLEFAKLSFGQYTTVKELVKDSGVTNMANMCACFIAKVGETWSDKSYFDNSAILYNGMSVQDAHNTMVFFCNIYKELSLITLDYFTEKAMTGIDSTIQVLKTHGGGV